MKTKRERLRTSSLSFSSVPAAHTLHQHDQQHQRASARSDSARPQNIQSMFRQNGSNSGSSGLPMTVRGRHPPSSLPLNHHNFKFRHGHQRQRSREDAIGLRSMIQISTRNALAERRSSCDTMDASTMDNQSSKFGTQGSLR